MSKVKYGACKEQTVVQTKDEYGADVTVVRSIVDHGHFGKRVSASAIRSKDGTKLAYAEGNDALQRILIALGATVIGLVVLASAGAIIYMLVTGMVG